MKSDSVISSLQIEPSLCYMGLTAKKTGESFLVGIQKEERRKHLYILGKTGMGKTTLLENMILQDVYNGFGVCYIDPHGDSSEYILDRIPESRYEDVVYINPADIENPVGFNILAPEKEEEPYFLASGLMAVFNKIWAGLWSARMEYILNNSLLALLEKPGYTLLSVVKLLTDDKFREKIVTEIEDPVIKNFWLNEFAKFNSRYQQEAISPILNKVGQFLSSEVIRNIIGQPKSTINLRNIIDTKKILIINVSKGRLGEDNSNLLGSLILARLQLAAMSRVDTAEKDRNDFYVYVDEFQNFTNDSFATILSEARKYRLNLILAHQYISQLTEAGNQKIKNAVFGNVGNLVSFRVGSQDAKEMSREFGNVYTINDLLNLEKAEAVIQVSENKKTAKAIKIKTISPIFDKLGGSKEEVINISRGKYAKSKYQVVSQIKTQLETNNYSQTKSNDPKNSKKIELENKILEEDLKKQKKYSENTVELKFLKK